MKPSTFLPTTTLLALLGTAGLAQALVTVVGTDVTDNTAANGDTLTVSGFDLGAGDTLVVAVSSEYGAGAPTYAVSFGGVPVTANVYANEGSQGSAIFWVVNPTIATGDVVVSLGGSSRAAVSVMSLSGVAGVRTRSDVSTSGGTPIDLDYPAVAGDVVVGTYVDNGFSTGATPGITGGNIDTVLQGFANNSSGGSAGIVQAYGEVDADGSFTESFNASRPDNSSRNAAALASFTSVPEPSTSITFLAGVGLVALRRRR